MFFWHVMCYMLCLTSWLYRKVSDESLGRDETYVHVRLDTKICKLQCPSQFKFA